MSRGKELIKNTGILLVARISTQIVSFFLLPLYTALLSTAEYGEVDIYTSLSAIIIPFLSLSLEMGLFRYYIASNNPKDKKSIITTSFLIIGTMMLIMTAIYLGVSAVFLLKYRFLIAGYYISKTVATVLLQVARAKGDNIGYGMASFLSSSLSVVLNVIFIAYFNMKVSGILWSTVIAQFISCIYLIIRTKVYNDFEIKTFDINQAKKLLNYSVPLVFNQIGSWAINYSDRIIILFFWGQAVNGIYSVANKFSNLMNTFFSVYNVAWTENVVRSIEDPDSKDYSSKIFNLTFQIYLLVITGIINILPFIFNLFVNYAYHDAYYHVPILLIAMLFSGMAATIGSIYIACNRTKEISVTTVMTGVCNITTHYLLLNILGLFAASISTFVSFFFFFVYRFIRMKKFYKISFQTKKITIQVFILIIACIGYYFMSNIIIILGLIANIAFIFYLLLSNKEIIRSMLMKKG